MKFFKTTGILFIAIAMLVSCKKYESFDKDFDFSAVSFAAQQPIRTIVAYENMQFKVGVALSGVRKLDKEEVVYYMVEPLLLEAVSGASGFKLLPPEYYTLSSPDKMVIPKGGVIGDVTVTLNRALFTADPEAVDNVYALPLRIMQSTTDSVLRGNATVPGKDYTILVVKYISPQHGTYYHKGVEQKVDAGGAVLETVAYSKKDLTQNATWNLSTLSLNQVRTSGIGSRTSGTLNLTKSADNSVVVEAASGATITSSSGTYEPTKREYYLQYNYTQGTGASLTRYSVKDTLILRQAPELDLRFEQW